MKHCSHCLGQNLGYPVWLGAHEDGRANLGAVVGDIENMTPHCFDCERACEVYDGNDHTDEIAKVRAGQGGSVMKCCNQCLGQSISYPVWVDSHDDGNADFSRVLDHVDGETAFCRDCNASCVPLDSEEDAEAIAQQSVERRGPPKEGCPQCGER